MNSSKKKVSDSPWFRGAVLSVFIHFIVLVSIFFGGFGNDRRSAEPEAIEGRIVSLSELEKMGSGAVSKEVKPPQPDKNKAPEEAKKTEPKKEKPARAAEVEKPEKKTEIKIPHPEKKETPKKTEKVEPGKKEEAPVVKKEEPKKEDTVVLNPKKETPKKETPKKEEKEEKQVAKVQEPDKAPETEEAENKESDFEDLRSKILEEMKKKLVIKDIRKGVEEREVALNESADTGEPENPANERSGSSGRAASHVISRLFQNRITEEIRNNWGIPANIPMDGTLTAVVFFKINESGKVSEVKVENSSGNSAFDEFCIQAIYRAAPLTPPPPELIEEAKTDGLEVAFTNEPT